MPPLDELLASGWSVGSVLVVRSCVSAYSRSLMSVKDVANWQTVDVPREKTYDGVCRTRRFRRLDPKVSI
jgi:hypothetical protein